MSTSTHNSSTHRPRRSLRNVPVWVWLLGIVGAVAGAALAEAGDFWGNTVPSTLTFLAAGLVLGLILWGITVLLRRR